MLISTRDFGDVEIKSQEILHFIKPIYGFDNLSKFVILQDKNIGEHFVWLQSTEDKDVCFILTEPFYVTDKYPPALSEDICQLLDEHQMQQSKCWVIAMIHKSFKETTVNLKSPILVDYNRKKGLQVILEDDYPVRCPLLSSEKGEG